MTTYEIVGLRNYSFNDEKTNRTIEGTKFFCIYEDEYDDELDGYKTISFSIPKRKLNTYLPHIGDKLLVSWADKKNYKVDSIEHING